MELTSFISRGWHMTPRANAAVVFAGLLCASVPSASGQQQTTEWTWKDGHGQVKSRADLDGILREHMLWLDSHGESGTRANLSHADLRKL